MPDKTKPRTPLHYLNNLKAFLIVLVVMHHSAEAYTLGEKWGVVSPQRTALLQPLLGINAAFFMGLFFLISGYFVPGSLARYGLGGFVRKKIQRLLIPAIFIISVVLPLAFSIFTPMDSFWDFYRHGWWSGKYFNLGYMWFILQLFLFSLAYGLFASLVKNPAAPKGPPGSLAIAGYALALGLATTAVNHVSPINIWFGYHLAEPYHLPQYVSLFAIGVVAGRNRWFEKIPARTGFAWMGAALGLVVLFLLVFAYAVLGRRSLDFPILYIWWGSFFCAAACTGLIVFFRERLNRTNRALGLLSDNAYGVYLFHIPFVLLVDKWMITLQAPALVKFFLTFLVAWTVANALAWLIRLYRPMRKFV